MAKVHKAHKSGTKYGFQKKKVNVKVLLIVLAVVIVAAIGLKIAYDNYVTGTFEVAAPSNEQMNNIAANWETLNSHTDKFMNYYTMLGYSEDGTDGAGNVLLLYMGNEKYEEVTVQMRAELDENADPTVATAGGFVRTTMTDFINGVAPWGQTTIQVQTANGNCAISIIDADAEEISDACLAEIIAEIEAVIAEGPVVAEEAPVEEVPAEEAAETPAE